MKMFGPLFRVVSFFALMLGSDVVAEDRPEAEAPKGKLEFRMVLDGNDQVVAMRKAGQPVPIPEDYELVPHRVSGVNGRPATTEEIVVAKKVEMSSAHVSKAEAYADGNSWAVLITFTPDGGKLFEAITGRMAKEIVHDHKHPMFAILLDGTVISAAGLTYDAAKHGGIRSGSAVISGSFSEKEARDIATALNRKGK